MRAEFTYSAHSKFSLVKGGDPWKLRCFRFPGGDMYDIDGKTPLFHVRISNPRKVRSSCFQGR